VHALKDINTSIKKSKFTILIGDIGSGKTSFLLAILNELRSSFKTNIEINGSIAYASQKPWILSGTVRDNIIFT
jgi:ABC-type transport system involved in cytochrome bd biosynthesis fused ATPase/permease subunit